MVATSVPTLLQAALDYGALGWRVAPGHDVISGVCSCKKADCTRSAGKHPRINEWQKKASWDATDIRRWWKAWPQANICVVAGQESNIWFLDVDGKDGLDELTRMELRHGALPLTPSFDTGGGGRQYIFAWPTDGSIVINGTHLDKKPIDTRGEGGQSVMPPSVSGRGEYAWAVREKTPVAHAPAWLYAWLRTQGRIKGGPAEEERRPVTPRPAANDTERRAIAYLEKCKPAVQGQRGSDDAFTAARAMVYGFDLGVENGLRLLLDHYNARCVPPWSEKELLHKCRDADTKEFDKPRGWLLNAPRNGTHLNGTEKPKVAPMPPAQDQQQNKKPAIYTVAALMAMDIPPVRWSVPGIMAEGLTILAGKPKLGKSWLALNLALTIAAGGKALGSMKVPPGDVLYLSLEDRLRRVKDRATKVLAGLGLEASTRMHIAVEWPLLDNGGLEAIAEWCASVSRPALIVADVWSKLRPPYNKGNQYDQDYQMMGKFKAVADQFNASALAVTHVVKGKAQDAFEGISGSTGAFGSADTSIVLDRARSEFEAILKITGRDVEDQELAIEFSPTDCTWICKGKASEVTDSKFKASVIEAFKRNPGTRYTANTMADYLSVPEDKRSYLKNLMYRMAKDQIISMDGPGKFIWPLKTLDDPHEMPFAY